MRPQRQAAAFTAWLGEHAADHADAFADVVGAEAAVTAWRRHLLDGKAAPSSVNQALAAVTLLYSHAGMRIKVKRARVPRPGEPDALAKAEQGRLERAAARRGARDRAITAVLLYAGARAGECQRLDAEDIAITARTGHVRLHGKGDEVRTVPLPRPPASTWAPGWTSAAPTTGRYGPGSAAGSPSPASPRSSWPSEKTPGSPGSGPTG